MVEKQTANLKMIAWEVTRNCNLSCRHCRASSKYGAHPNELTTSECFKLMDEIVSFAEPQGNGLASDSQSQKPIIILTGGEPLLRKDIFEIAEYGKNKGLTMVMAPNGTLLNDENIVKIISAGIKRISVSLDGSDAASHDELRQVPGAFERACEGIGRARSAGLEFQINTTVTKRNIKLLPRIMELAKKLGAKAHHIFLLVPTGRAKDMIEDELSAQEYEEALKELAKRKKKIISHCEERSDEAISSSNKLRLLHPFGVRNDDGAIKVTCAPHFNRVLLQEHSDTAHSLSHKAMVWPHLAKAISHKAMVWPHLAKAMRGRGCMAGVGFCFVSHVGDLQPCGYLEIKCGNVRDLGFKKAWLESEVFNNLRDLSKYKGKCGICEFKSVCGGCRARAYAKYGDYLREEPYCMYTPGSSLK